MKYRYAVAVTGIIEAPSEEHAQLQVLMGVSINSRLAIDGPDVAVQVEREAKAVSNNGDPRSAKPMEH